MNYYPGCSLHGSAREYDASVQEVCRRMEWPLEEVPDWNCCGAGVATAADPVLGEALALRNLALAEERGEELLVPCAACYNRLRRAQVDLERGVPAAVAGARRLERASGRRTKDAVRVLHLLDWWARPEVMGQLRQATTHPWNGLPVAAYYGCLLLRPREVACDDPEQPRRMETLLAALGAKPVTWSGRLECCGGGQTLAVPDAVRRRVSNIVGQAKAAGAKAIITACPMCQSNLDGYQGEMGMPVLFLSEVVAGALGADLGSFLRRHLTPSGEVQNLVG